MAGNGYDAGAAGKSLAERTYLLAVMITDWMTKNLLDKLVLRLIPQTPFSSDPLGKA